MNKFVEFIIKFLTHSALLWSSMGAVFLFQGDWIKNNLSNYWYLICLIPIFTSLYIVYLKPKNEEESMNNDSENNQPSDSTNNHKKIITHGDFSPAEVGQNYEVIIKSDKKEPSRNQADTTNHEEKDDAVITTKGNYSPAVVKGDYKIEEE